MSNEFKKDSIGAKIILYLGETIEGLFDLGITMTFSPHVFLRGGPFMEGSPRSLNQGINQLKRTGYLKSKGNKLCVTPKGRIKIIKFVLQDRKKKKLDKKKWDGKWRGVIFDIPELSRRERNLLRSELKWIGFREAQKSIWIYPFDIEKELKALMKLWRIDLTGDIRFILIEKMDDKDLRKVFGLK